MDRVTFIILKLTDIDSRLSSVMSEDWTNQTYGTNSTTSAFIFKANHRLLEINVELQNLHHNRIHPQEITAIRSIQIWTREAAYLIANNYWRQTGCFCIRQTNWTNSLKVYLGSLVWWLSISIVGDSNNQVPTQTNDFNIELTGMLDPRSSTNLIDSSKRARESGTTTRWTQARRKSLDLI